MSPIPQPSMPPDVDPGAIRRALDGIPGVAEVRVIRGNVWVVRDEVDVERDGRIIDALLEVLPPDVEFHMTTVSRLGMVPDGPRAL